MMSMVRALRVMSWVVAMLMWVSQVVCRLVAPLVLSLRRVLLGVLWAVVSSVVPMARVTWAMHWVTVRPVCAVGDALGTGGGGPEGGLPLVQRAMVALMPQVVALVMVLLVIPTRWFVCLSARGVGSGVGWLPVRVVVGAPGAWWAWSGAGARVGVFVVRLAGGLWASGALLPCVWVFVLSVERGRRVRCVGVVGSGRRGWCRCGCLGLGAGCARVVRAVWSGVMVVPLATLMVTPLQVVRVGRRCWRFPVWVLWVVWSVGVLQVWCGADGGVLGDGVVSAAGGGGCCW